MKQICLVSFVFVSMLLFGFSVKGQGLEKYPLIWERSQIELGSVLEEYGEVTAEFYVLNNGLKPVVLKEVATDCGCTTADYTTDTLYQDKIGRVKIAYDPQGTGGRFKKEIIVRNNLNPKGDTLYLEGYEIPHPEKVAQYYNSRVGDLGFRFSSINIGVYQ